MKENNAIVMVSTKSINLGPRLFRALDEEVMTELMASIQKNGILQALLVEKEQGGVYTLLAGFNRLDAAKRLGLAEVPCKTVTANEKVAAIFDTDLIRRDLDHEEKVKMQEIKGEYEKDNRKNMEQHLIPEYKDIAHYLNENTLQYLCNIPVEEQQRLFNAMPEKITEDTVKLDAKEKQILAYDKEIQELRKFKTNSEKDLKAFEDYKEKYEALQQTRQKDLEKLLDAKKREIEEEFRGDADENIRIAYEKAKEEVEQKLQKEIEEQRTLAAKMSVEVNNKNTIIATMKEEIAKFDELKKDSEKDRVKLQNKIQQQTNIVAAISSPQTISDRCKIIVMDADQIRNTIVQCGPDLWINEKNTRLAIKKHLTGAIEVINEIEKFLNTIKPSDTKEKNNPLDNEEGKEILQ